MTKKITDLEGRLESAFNRADSIPHTITLTRAELQAEWDRACELVKRLSAELEKVRGQRDELLAAAKIAVQWMPGEDSFAASAKKSGDKAKADAFTKLISFSLEANKKKVLDAISSVEKQS